MRSRYLSAVFLLLASLTASLQLFSTREVAADTAVHSSLRFFESLAVSDFDGDGLADRAKLRGPGPHKSIEIFLSTSGKRSLIQFDTTSIQDGSLFAGDVDSDGEIDLVWTDLLHREDVVVWLGDGTGQFELVCPRAYADRFVSDRSNTFDGPTGTGVEGAARTCRGPHTDQALAPAVSRFTLAAPTTGQRVVTAARSAIVDHPTGRGPPQILS